MVLLVIDYYPKMSKIGQSEILKNALELNPFTVNSQKCHRSVSQTFLVDINYWAYYFMPLISTTVRPRNHKSQIQNSLAGVPLTPIRESWKKNPKTGK